MELEHTPYEVKRKPGRPAKHATAAARQAAYRARKGQSITVFLPDEVMAEFVSYMTRHHMDGTGGTVSDVIVNLVRQQLLRKR